MNNTTVFSGDIYEVEFNNGNTREAIILAVHDGFSTILCLGNNESMPCAINCRGMKYANPGMLQYVVNNKLREFVRSLTDQEYDYIMYEVVNALGYKTIKPTTPAEIVENKPSESKADKKDEMIAQSCLELAKIQAERDVYKGLYEKLLAAVMQPKGGNNNG